MSAAWEVERLKLRRSAVARSASLALVVGSCLIAAAFTSVGLAGGDSQLATKVRPMLLGTGWEAYLGMLAQILSVGTLLAIGVLAAWVVGREFTDGTVASIQALPTPPSRIVWAKIAAVVLSALSSGVAAVLVAVVLGVLIGLGRPDAAALEGASRALVVVALSTLLALPVALVASVRRGYLPAIGALLGIVVVTQVATVAGAGAWFPWAAPGMWAGLGGQAAAAAVTPLQLALAVPVGVVASLLTARWWSTAEL